MSTNSGLAIAVGPVSPSSKTKNRIEIPTCGAARPTPGASIIVSSMSSESLRSDGPKSVTGLAGSRRTGSPRVLMRRIIRDFQSEVRLGLDAIDEALHGQLSEPLAESRHPLGVEGEQAYRPPLPGGDEQRPRLEDRELPLERVRPRDPEDRGAERESGVSSTVGLVPMEPVGVPADQGLDHRIARGRRLDDRASARSSP